MALFTDSAIVTTVDDLLTFEVSLVQMASPHGINVDTKIGLASSAIRDKLMLWLVDSGISDPHLQPAQLGLPRLWLRRHYGDGCL